MKYAVSIIAYGVVAMEADSPEEAERRVYDDACHFDFRDSLNGKMEDVLVAVNETIPYEEWEENNL